MGNFTAKVKVIVLVESRAARAARGRSPTKGNLWTWSRGKMGFRYHLGRFLFNFWRSYRYYRFLNFICNSAEFNFLEDYNTMEARRRGRGAP